MGDVRCSSPNAWEMTIRVMTGGAHVAYVRVFTGIGSFNRLGLLGDD
jgi:hypothetical protein